MVHRTSYGRTRPLRAKGPATPKIFMKHLPHPCRVRDRANRKCRQRRAAVLVSPSTPINSLKSSFLIRLENGGVVSSPNHTGGSGGPPPA